MPEGAQRALGKPFSVQELVVCVAGEVRPRFGPIQVDVNKRVVMVHHRSGVKSVALAPAELKLLQCLMDRADLVLGREAILSLVWGNDSDMRTVDQTVRRLRKYLSRAGAGDVSHTVRGLGYRYMPSL